jgi:tetratricopeptide (TPR) repeat protein
MGERGHGDIEEAEAEEALDALNPTGVALALGRVSKSKAVDAEAIAFLGEQRRLIGLQAEHLHEQRALQLEHLKVRRWKDRLSLALQALGIVAGVGVAAGLAWMVIGAANDHGLVVRPFQTPPDMAQQGVNGQVLAARVLDRLVELDDQTNSVRAGHTYADDWGEAVKLEIPETGISIGELDRWLRRTLGHETRISGELYRTPTGDLVMSVRAGEHAGSRIVQQGADFDGMVDRAAEAIFAQAQPYRYGKYLENQGRLAEAKAVAVRLTEGPAEERPWAWGQLSNLYLYSGDYQASIAAGGRALALKSDLYIGAENRAGGEEALGYDEAALRDVMMSISILKREPDQVVPEVLQSWGPTLDGVVADYLGDHMGAARAFRIAAAGPNFQHLPEHAPAFRAYELAMSHDLAAAALAGSMPPSSLITDYINNVAFYPDVDWARHVAVDDWSAALADLQATEAAARLQGKPGQVYIERMAWPLQAQALAGLGRGDEAWTMANRAPLDCYVCLRMRGFAAASRRDWPSAEWWFDRATRHSPSIPYAYLDWARARMARGDMAGAIAKLALAHQKGPRFADVLETWGEALVRQGDMARAIDKFRQADALTPRWGRNHLMWGEALRSDGQGAAARRQFVLARGMDLSSEDRLRLDSERP